MEPTRPEKILLAMHALSKGTTQPCRYEDIVVKAFELYPKDFQLRGYPKFPDSSDIHKPLYGPLKRQGLVRSGNKSFALTDKGLGRATELSGGDAAKPATKTGAAAERLPRDMALEIERIMKSSAAQLFVTGDRDRILDTDFYSYVGVTVRTAVTRKNDFLGRLKSVTDAVQTAARVEPTPAHAMLLEMHNYLIDKFGTLLGKSSEASA